MNYRIRKAAVSLLAAGLTLGWAALPVLGSAEAVVEDISDDSTGNAEASDEDSLLVLNVNFGLVGNFDSSSSDTGNNLVTGGGDGNSIETGGAGAGVSSDNFLNTNDTSVSGGGASAHATVRRVSDDSSGTAIASDDDSLAILNLNCLFESEGEWLDLLWFPEHECGILNETEATAETGENTIAGDDDNSISTGPADAEALALNVMNTNQTEVSGWGNSAFATVEDISDDSTGYAEASDEDSLLVLNANFGGILNWTGASADTGNNLVTGGGDNNSIGTGGATATAGSANFLNTNETSVSGGESDGSADATVSEVSDDSSGTAIASDDDSTAVINANLGLVENGTEATAETGENTIAGDDDNSISTGDASATSGSSNVVNTNVTTIEM